MNAHALDVLVPVAEWQENYGTRRRCLDFSYNPECEHPIIDYPKAVEFKGVIYVRTGHNSDTNIIHYKEGNVAFKR